MPTNKLIFLLILSISLATVVSVLPWIPSWSSIPGIFVGIAILSALYFSWQLLSRLSKRLLHSQVSSLQSSITLLACSIMLLGIIGITSLFSGFMAAGGLFPPKLLRTYEFPDAGVNLYYYNSSFLDPEVTLYAQRSFLPFMLRLKNRGGYMEAPEAVRQGEWVTLTPFRYHLPSGECELEGY